MQVAVAAVVIVAREVMVDEVIAEDEVEEVAFVVAVEDDDVISDVEMLVETNELREVEMIVDEDEDVLRDVERLVVDMVDVYTIVVVRVLLPVLVLSDDDAASELDELVDCGNVELDVGDEVCSEALIVVTDLVVDTSTLDDEELVAEEVVVK